MAVLFGLLWPLQRVNDALLAAGRALAVAALAIMVCLILAQIFFRYFVGDALNWTEEAARFGMLWMVGLMAPLAYRLGGFVSIDMLERALPRRGAALLSLILLSMSFAVLVVMAEKGWNNHVDTMSGRGCSSSLRWPFGIEIGRCGVRFANSYQYASLFVGCVLMLLVSAELIIRQVIVALGRGERLRPLRPDEEIAGAS